ncbi:TIR domain-containing protein [Vibrio penaeicida]|uniref:TIR domain-containing protein n=1 Tax=Vibrio penaeicida TaxID=104609 RepID=UPI000CE9EB99|nr:TIR domain-containing protein [Vibrio penaeicida]
MAKFISYDNDRHYKNLLLAWDANGQFKFGFHDHSADVSVNSTDATIIKRAISAKINNAHYFLCIVGKDTYKSDWVKWEIEKAVKLKKRIVAVKTDRGNAAPSEIYGVGASWTMSFKFDSVCKAVNDA